MDTLNVAEVLFHVVSEGALVRYLKLGVEDSHLVLVTSMDEASSK